MPATNSIEKTVDQAITHMQNSEDSPEYADQVSLRLQNLIEAQPEPAQSSAQSWWSGLQRWGSTTKIKAASAFSFVGALLLASTLFLGSATAPLYADMVEQLKAITSMTYHGKMTVSGNQLMDIKVYYQHPNMLRVDTLPLGNASDGASINILDLTAGTGTIAFPVQNVSVPYQFDPNGKQQLKAEEDPLAWYHSLLNADAAQVTNIEPRQIDGQRLPGFLVEEQGIQVRVWIDNNTQLPAYLEVRMPQQGNDDLFKLEAELTFNQVIDGNLFQLGY